MNITHAVDAFLVREVVRRCNYDREQLVAASWILHNNRDKISTNRVGMHQMEIYAHDHGFVSLRGAEFITEETVLLFSNSYRDELLNLINETLTRPSFTMLTIHDEFKCHPNYVNEMRAVYKTILAELADSRVGEQIIREVRNDPSYVLPKLSTDLGDHIMNAEYFLS